MAVNLAFVVYILLAGVVVGGGLGILGWISTHIAEKRKIHKPIEWKKILIAISFYIILVALISPLLSPF